MVATCFVNGCKNRGKIGNPERSFHRFPKVIDGQCEKTRMLSEERRRKWIANVNRAEKPSERSLVCSERLIGGKPAALFDNTNPSWAPTLKMAEVVQEKPNEEECRDQAVGVATPSVHRYDRAPDR